MADEQQQQPEQTIDDIYNPKIYGFRSNLRKSASDQTMRFEFLDNMVKNSDFGITVKRAIISIIALFGLGFTILSYLFTNMVRFNYIVIPIGLLLAGILILSVQFMFVEPAHGSFLNRSFSLYIYIIEMLNIKRGKTPAPRQTNISRVRANDSVIEFANGYFGFIYEVDGNTSSTSFPEEIARQRDLSASYQNGRERGVYEVKITSSQRQSTEVQEKRMKELLKYDKPKPVLDMIQQQYRYMNKYIDGRKSTILQYILIVAPTEDVLWDYCDRFEEFNRRGLYYQIDVLDKPEIDRVLSIYEFK